MTEEQIKMIGDLADVKDKMTPWEIEFINDISAKTQDVLLSEGRASKLEQIWTERSKKG